MMRPLALAVALALALLGRAPLAHADDLQVALFAPSAPFAGTSARVEYVTRLADHLGDALATRAAGKTYARASDFAAAARKGAVDVAVVDATYLAALGVPYTVVATSTRDGATGAAWQLVTRGGEARILDLAGKTLLAPTLGGREDDLVLDALLGGELPRDFFASITASPDVVSLLAALGLGRADAAVVPGGVDLPAGVTRVATLPRASYPVLVVIRGNAERRRAVAAAAARFTGGDVLAGFTAGGADDVRAFAARFTRRDRRGPMVVPILRLPLDDLLAARTLVIPRTPIEALLAPAAPLPPPR